MTDAAIHAAAGHCWRTDPLERARAAWAGWRSIGAGPVSALAAALRAIP